MLQDGRGAPVPVVLQPVAEAHGLFLAVADLDTLNAAFVPQTSGYNRTMGITRPKKAATPKVVPPPSKRPDLARGLPGTEQERAEQRRRFAEEHRETLRRLGK